MLNRTNMPLVIQDTVYSQAGANLHIEGATEAQPDSRAHQSNDQQSSALQPYFDLDIVSCLSTMCQLFFFSTSHLMGMKFAQRIANDRQQQRDSSVRLPSTTKV